MTAQLTLVSDTKGRRATLTHLGCQNARPREKAYKLAAGKGLFLLVLPSGAKSWRMKYRFADKEKLLTFGHFPEVSLAEAGTRRDAARALLRDGIDPAAEKRRVAAAAKLDQAQTFRKTADDWLDLREDRWSEKYGQDVRRSLQADVYPAIGNLPLKELTAPAILAVVRAIERRQARETAHRVLSRIQEVFGFAISEGLVDLNPAAGITTSSLKPVITRRYPAFREIGAARALLRKCEAEPGHPGTKLASRLLALTAVRPGVVASARKDEFVDLDGEAPRWELSAERMKLSRERKADTTFDFTVPLSWQAVAVVKASIEVAGRGPLLFPNDRHAHRPMSNNALSAMYKRFAEGRGRHVPHGWRSTFSTIMNERAMEAGRPADRVVIDLMLAHVQKGVEPIYNRAAYMPRRREIAQEWADLLLDGFLSAESLHYGRRK